MRDFFEKQIHKKQIIPVYITNSHYIRFATASAKQSFLSHDRCQSNGNNGQWGWGYFAGGYFDSNRITVKNHALGGTSSRTFYNRLWPDVIKGVRPGDWVIIELGHNDNGPYDSGCARASIPGIGKDTVNITIKETGVKETVLYIWGIYAPFYPGCKS